MLKTLASVKSLTTKYCDPGGQQRKFVKRVRARALRRVARALIEEAMDLEPIDLDEEDCRCPDCQDYESDQYCLRVTLADVQQVIADLQAREARLQEALATYDRRSA